MALSSVLPFLHELSQNNTKEWFTANKASYEEARQAFEAFVGRLIRGVSAFDPEIGGLEAKKCIFRIYRDVRFAKDKSPYKTNFGAYLVKDRQTTSLAGYYIHIDPAECFLAGGLYVPANENLRAVRNEVYDRIDEFLAIINAPAFKTWFGSLEGDKLKKPPRDFPADFEHIEYLKHKSYLMMHNLSPGQIDNEESLLTHALEVFQAMLPLNRFLNDAVQYRGNE